MRPSIRLLTCTTLLPFLTLTVQANEAPAVTEKTQAEASVPAESFVPLSQPPGDLDHLPEVFKAYRDADLAEAEILKTKLTRPAAQALAEWFAIRSGIPVGFERMVAFRKAYPDWPATSLLRRRIEDALLEERPSAEKVSAFFSKNPPVTTTGQIAFAFALKAGGREQEANDLIRRVWRENGFSAATERRILDSFSGVLSQADHRFRMERHLLRKSWSAAKRAAGYAGGGYDTLVKARMSVFGGRKAAEKALAAVPANLRKDPSYLFSRALLLRRSDKLVEAAQVIVEAPRDPELRVEGDAWWAEQRLIARSLLDENKAREAYEVASHHAAESPVRQIEAEFHAGWIALRFLKDPAKAARHFATVADTASTPISVSRVAYWQGRAAEAAGAQADAKRFYRRAAEYPVTYYGQLAQEHLGETVPLRTAPPLTGEKRAAFEALVPVQAAELLQQVGETELAIRLYSDLAETLEDPGQLDALAASASAQNNPRALLAIGKIALQRGFPLDRHAYPIAAIPDFEPVGEEVIPAMIYAIARQESAFNPRAISSAGARGLMQLMPATAKYTAKRFGVAFDLNRLTEDPAYNAKLGSAHLSELMDYWKGSHILAFASYNAGGGNVRKWVKAYGDPRKPGVDVIDWVERIPFYETRNYVQRVMENLHVYRLRLSERISPVHSATTAATGVKH